MVLLGCLGSLLPAFYPFEAELRGATATEYGTVFGIMNIGICITSLYYSKYGSNHDVKLCLCCGYVTDSLCGVVFSLMIYISSSSLFIWVSCLIRFIAGIAHALGLCSATTILMTTFPDKVMVTMTSTLLVMKYSNLYLYDVIRMNISISNISMTQQQGTIRALMDSSVGVGYTLGKILG